MKIKLIRHTFTSTATIGDLYVNDAFICNTLEDVDRHLESGGKKIYAETAIPCGEYRIKWTYSPRFGKMLPELLNVPQFAGVRIHAGNSSKDTEGCLLCGKWNKRDKDWISDSRNTIQKLFTLIQCDENLTITIKRK